MVNILYIFTDKKNNKIMKQGNEVIAFALKLVGRPYVLGATVPKDNANYSGPLDCAEFIAFSNYQVFGIVYGCDNNDIKHIHNADAYTGYFERDANKLGKIIHPAQAAQIPGAMLLRFPAPGANGHIVFSQGNGKSVEANCTKYGCIESILTGRRFDIGILLPGVNYIQNANIISNPPSIVYRYKTPLMVSPFIGQLQKALSITVDNTFGPETLNAVIAFQKAHGLVVDGEVSPGGETVKALNI